MSKKSKSFRVGKVKGYLRGQVYARNSPVQTGCAWHAGCGENWELCAKTAFASSSSS